MELWQAGHCAPKASSDVGARLQQGPRHCRCRLVLGMWLLHRACQVQPAQQRRGGPKVKPGLCCAGSSAGGLCMGRLPMVMREGMAWGLMMRSGTIPSCVQGMSSWV